MGSAGRSVVQARVRRVLKSLSESCNRSRAFCHTNPTSTHASRRRLILGQPKTESTRPKVPQHYPSGQTGNADPSASRARGRDVLMLLHMGVTPGPKTKTLIVEALRATQGASTKREAALESRTGVGGLPW